VDEPVCADSAALARIQHSWPTRRSFKKVRFQMIADNDGEEPPKAPKLPRVKDGEFGETGKQAHYMTKLVRLLGKMDEKDRKLIFELARKTTAS
jgi:hypothetical protein